MPERKRHICVVTGSRADYGLLYWVMKEIAGAPGLELQIVVTGMHLAPQFGSTYRAIEADGFRIDARVDMLLSSDTAVGVTKSMGLGVMGFADVLDRLRPDILLVLGDRYEILAAVQAALVACVPVAHIAGGDVTEGAFDEAIRHSITKMSHIHFVTNAEAARRVRQLGENPASIHDVGSPGLDYLCQATLLDRRALEAQLGYRFREKNLLVTFHPVTLDAEAATGQCQALLDALDRLDADVGIVFTKPNSDTSGMGISALIDEYVATRSHAKVYVSLGQLRYLSLMAQVDAVVGNSSSGLYEAPSFGIPTVNIGDRQKGRLQASSVFNCDVTAVAIAETIATALAADCADVANPYGDGRSAPRILHYLEQIGDPKALLKKSFFEWNANHE